MERRRIADTLARAGLHMSATTVRRMLDKPPVSQHWHWHWHWHWHEERTSRPASSPTRTVIARYPHHVWNMDLTIVPTAAGLWIPFFPGSITQRWPFAWWALVVLDHLSRSVVGFDLFRKRPSADELCSSLDRIVSTAGSAPKYTVTDQRPQFGDAFRAWCAPHHERPRFGAIGKHGSIAVTEPSSLSLKNEAL